MHAPRLLVLGKLTRSEMTRLWVLAEEAELQVQPVDDPAGLLDGLSDEETVAILIVAARPGDEQVCARIRAHAVGRFVPMLVLVPTVDDLAFGNALASGADDVVELAATRFLRARLRRFRRELGRPRPRARGLVVVADPDHERRANHARAFRSAGFDVAFAASVAEAEHALRDPAARVALYASDLPGALVGLTASAQEHSVVAHLLSCPPAHLELHARSLATHRNATVLDAYAMPESAVFAANELHARGRDQRRSRRYSYGTTAAFRAAGRDADDLGFSHNVSVSGLFIRTLAPPEGESVWLELLPPRSTHRVRLEGRIVWRLDHGGEAGGTAPPGFGVELGDGRRGLEEWQAGHRGLMRSRDPTLRPQVPE